MEINVKNAECEQKTTTEKKKFGSNKRLGLKLNKNGLGKNI